MRKTYRVRVTGEDDVRVVYRKYDGSLHWHMTMRYLGTDRYGGWLGARAGLTARRGENGPSLLIGHPHVMLVPREAWWTAVFNGEPADVEVYCDIATPAQWPHPGEVTMVDLDLDVCRRRADRSVELLDEDEFAEHTVRYGYPADVVDHAREAAHWLHGAVSDGIEPFAAAHLRWLALVS